MNEPLRIDLRLVLETLADGLAVLVVGVAAMNLPDPYRVGVPLAITVLLVMVNRLSGAKGAAVITGLGKANDGLTAANTVLVSAATPAVVRKAEAALAALNPAAKDEEPAPG